MVTATNEYSRIMVQAFDEMGLTPAPVAFQGAFFGRPETGAQTVIADDAGSIEIDIIRANERTLARMLHRGTSSTDVSRAPENVGERWTNVAFGWPLIEDYASIESSQLEKRVAGENPYMRTSREERMLRLALKHHMNHLRRHITTMDYLCREALFNGQHPVILGTSNTDLIYDFYRNAANTISVANAWNSGSQTIIADIDSGIDAVQQNGFMYGGEYGMLVGTDAYADIIADDDIIALADNRRFYLAEIGKAAPTALPERFQKYRENGFSYRGFLETDKGRTVYIFTYDRTFLDDFTNPASPTEANWVPTDEALIFHPMARCDRYFGPMDRMPFMPDEFAFLQEYFGINAEAVQLPDQVRPGVVDPRVFHPYAIMGEGRKSVHIVTQSAPIFPTTHTDAFATLTDLHT